MPDTDRTRAHLRVDDGDVLGELIRAAGRRPSPSAGEYERVRLVAHLAWQTKVHAGRRRRMTWWAMAAGVATAALGLLATVPWAPPASVAEVVMMRGRIERFASEQERWEPLATGMEIAAGTRLRAAPDSGAAFRLADGADLRARGGTEWVFDDALRVTLTGGTLYVDSGSSSSAARPLEIVTPHGVVRHIGTQYEVRALSTELRVRVREGRVQLNSQNSATPYDTLAGEELVVARDGTVERRSIATDDSDWHWAEALAAPIELDGGSAFTALQWVARETGKRLVFEDANTELLARNAIIHGSSAGFEPLQVLEIVMATSAQLDYTLADGTLIVRRR